MALHNMAQHSEEYHSTARAVEAGTVATNHDKAQLSTAQQIASYRSTACMIQDMSQSSAVTQTSREF